MDKRPRREKGAQQESSPPESLGQELRNLPFSPQQEEKESKKGGRHQGKVKGKSETESGENFRKKSKIHELLNSFKEDVIHVKDTSIASDEVSTDRYPTPGSGSTEFPSKFTRVSPQKIGSHSKWKQAVKLSKTVVNRPKSSQDETSGVVKDEDEDAENQIKMKFLLNFIDHASCISSGLHAGLLLWSSINSFSKHEDLIRSTYTDNFVILYYTATAILMYITLIGFLIRIYTSWSRGNMWIIVHILAFISVLILHYANKGYCLLRLECIFYDGLPDDLKKKALSPHACSPQSEIKQQDFIVVAIMNSIQAVGSIFIACYFHFTTYKPFGTLELLSSHKSSNTILE